MRKTEKRVQKILCVLVIVVFISGNSGFISSAAEAESSVEVIGDNVETLEAKVIEDVEEYSEISLYTMLTSCMITVGCKSDGMHIDISTGTVGESSVSGVKDIKIWKKNSNGQWDLVAISSGGEDYNCIVMGVTILYSNAVKGATYKITCVHYGNVNGYIEGSNDSGEFVFTY